MGGHSAQPLTQRSSAGWLPRHVVKGAWTPCPLSLWRLSARYCLPLPLQMLSSGLITQAQAFAADARLPPNEGMAFRLRLVRVLHQLGEQLAKVGGSASGWARSWVGECEDSTMPCKPLLLTPCLQACYHSATVLFALGAQQCPRCTHVAAPSQHARLVALTALPLAPPHHPTTRCAAPLHRPSSLLRQCPC